MLREELGSIRKDDRMGIIQTGDWRKTTDFLKHITPLKVDSILDKYGRMGVQALKAATPVRTGKTASSWFYEIVKNQNETSIQWSNSNVNKGVNIAIIIQMGHGTRNGGYVVGRDYINPALAPIFDQMADEIFKEVSAK